MLTRLKLLSKQPRILTCNKFLSDLECDTLIKLGEQKCTPLPGDNKLRTNFSLIDEDDSLDFKTKSFLKIIENRVAALTGTPPHNEEVGLQLHFTPPETYEEGRLSLGLHTDTNQRFFRFVTALIYLNTIPSEHDGFTIFPLVGQPHSSPLIKASSHLIANNIEHTNSAFAPFNEDPTLPLASQQLLRASNTTIGLHVKPEKGKLILFYSRDDKGDIDPFGWHGGASVLGTGKWTLQKFKEVPKRFRRQEKDFREFINSKYFIPAASTGTENYIIEELD